MQVTQHNADVSTAPQLAPEHMTAIASHGFRTVINTGRIGNQEVYHLHVHIIGGPEPMGGLVARRAH